MDADDSIDVIARSDSDVAIPLRLLHFIRNDISRMRKVTILALILFICSGWRWGRGISVSQLKEEHKNYFSLSSAKDSKGNLYRTPHLYGGNSVPIEKSIDNGKNWRKVGEVKCSLTYSAWGSSLFVDKKDKIYLVCGGSVQFSRSTDYGRSWSAATPIPNGKGYQPEAFVDSQGTIYVTWYAGRDIVRDIYLSISHNEGRRWKTPERLRQGEDAFFTESDNVVYLSYVRGKTLYFSYTRDRGETWNTETFGFLVPMKEPYVKIHKGTVYLLFQGYKPDPFNLIPGSEAKYNLFFTTSKDMGKTWKGFERLTNN